VYSRELVWKIGICLTRLDGVTTQKTKKHFYSHRFENVESSFSSSSDDDDVVSQICVLFLSYCSSSLAFCKDIFVWRNLMNRGH
jgi:hypothetical protein